MWNFNGENIVAVRLENKSESSRWYPGAGIYRNVRLVVTEPVSVDHWGTYVTTPVVSKKKGGINLETRIANKTGGSVKVRLESLLMDEKGNLVTKTSSTENIKGDKCVFNQKLSVRNPELWSVKNPYLYKVVSNVYVGDKLYDTYNTSMGFRSFKFDKDKGFFLNGENVKLKGVCLHHDLGPLGSCCELPVHWSVS